MTELGAGSVLGERYRLEHLLGEGGMGAVWAAHDQEMNERVALKVLKGKVSPTDLRRFMREARAAMAVKHPNVVQVHRVDTCDGLPVMVMDLLEGESLGAFVARQGGILTLPELSSILLPVLSAVGTAHSMGIVHRDLKPENIFLKRGAQGVIVPMVLDFGIAKLSAQEGEAASTGALTGTGAMLGTPYYMSPEQAFGEKDVDHRADIWALGIVMFHCLSGVRPVDGDNMGQIMKLLMTGALPSIHDVAPALPQDVRDVIAHMLVADRTQRCSSLADTFNVLAAHTQDTPPVFPSAPPRRDYPSGPMSALAASVTPGAAMFAPTPVPEQGITGQPVSTNVSLPVRSSAPLVRGALAVALLASLGAGGLYLRGRPGTAQEPARSTGDAPPQVVSAPSAVLGAARPGESPTAADSVAPALPAAALSAPAPAEVRRPGATPAPRASSPGPSPAPSGSAAPKAKAPALPGQMQEVAPF